MRTPQRGNAVRDALRHKRGRRASRTACRRGASHDSCE
ncbi:DUF1534 domain-containing protein [Pseudomonas savastanoi pv. phaseolicola]|nr:DUF1534 domain-containing protein [Pseudomonas savastanoi pv. phaseolicola]PYD21203.1 hypothetical protein DND36_20090 [Pseudomonas savastanoi pv. glycinea]QDV99033.1 DUF1534 domain-containing protein [Pseudomonas sp. KBS0707]QED86782.1 DUF1534 domain-containing protein [Pseudomonas amygdali pv. tabaci str. ATCC 11528]QOI07075.1 DUF1534 domain-containing protein [Pseudomonas savastanoi]